ncbi:hypothetical protein N8I77_011878 [Diaporthe amygdali]|uniref:Uncharacterized protein n=1 Tax=Phomopsis amygdali TaxID=1214568 RepID=A0AAD9S525_PHOAM|nr:hypothetical protein N8I77_011878 [Diaporthe amygdali]
MGSGTDPASSQMTISRTLEELQTDEQRRVLDTVSQVRKCGLETVLSLPQIVVCGDQSAGKSSVLEALTEIPFPRNDNLCTRFATEICLRRDPLNSLTIRVIPDSNRPQKKQEEIKKYSETITDFKDLPAVMNNALKVMDITEGGNAFAKDTLSVEICGPSRPQLTLVDIPGLIQTSTKGVSDADVALVAEITDHYIKQPRTICLAVISATNDAANQPILQKVRKFDPQGDRTLGVITKPDRLSAGSGSETKFLELARNEDVFFKLGWHVIKNRKFEEMEFSIEERNFSEKTFFSTSSFNTLPKDNVAIDSLRVRLSYLLFEHVKNELPRLQRDLESALKVARDELQTLGNARSTVVECRSFLTQVTMECYDICRSTLNGHYDHPYFKSDPNDVKLSASDVSQQRLRASVQLLNCGFATEVDTSGHKYSFTQNSNASPYSPFSTTQALNPSEAKAWVKRKLRSARGTELIGNYNPQVVGELFWEQSEKWEALAKNHVDKNRIWASMVVDVLKAREQAALAELAKLVKDKNAVPINYNHYYTDNVHKNRGKRLGDQLEKHVPNTIRPAPGRCNMGDHYSVPPTKTKDELGRAITNWSNAVTADMEDFSCEEALDCLKAIYNVQKKVFVANVTVQVIERHLLEDLHEMFSPMVVLNMSDAKVQSMVSERESAKLQRVFLSDRIKKLKEGQDIFRSFSGP